ncbi:MAG: NADPH:quinone reductase [Wenzhouxiangellaceae bacterium]|nr:NADPH:quinone reductase [Wenzhouxiangellaceae bacterium]
MRAAFYSRTGPAREALDVGEVETPAPGPGEVLVRIRTSGVNPSDVKNRSGARGDRLPFERIIPHSDGAGIIEAVGSGVDRHRVGQRVWIWNGQWQRPNGTAAEYITVPGEQAVELPESTGFAEGACLGIPATTAWYCVHGGADPGGQTVLVSGGAGAVAHYAIQFAVLAGARVIATASSPEKAAHARSAGADQVVDYGRDNVAEAVAEFTGGNGVNRIIDAEFGANVGTSADAIAAHGEIFAYGSALAPTPELPFYKLLFKSAVLHTPLVYLLPGPARAGAIRGINEALARNELIHTVDCTLPLEEIAAAHERVERQDKLGTVVVTIP